MIAGYNLAMTHVVLVDDNIKAIEGLRRHIPWSETGCVCAGVASNGVEALQLCQRLHPDVVITDVKMPLMDGLELCRSLRAEFPDLHLMVISAYDDFAFAQHAMTFGVVNYILKPIDDKKIAEIARLLKQISQASQQHSASLSTFFTSSVLSDLAAALNEGDAAALDRLLLDSLRPDHFTLPTVKEVAANLLAALYRHLAHLGLPAAVDGQSLAESLAVLPTLHAPSLVASYVQRQYAWVCRRIAETKKPGLPALVQKAKQYIQDNYADPQITTYSIAHKLHISQSYLCQLYRSIEKTSINAFLTELRIEHACRLMASSDLPIYEIARQVGYPDAHYFAKVFRKVKGLPPSGYKELARPHD